MTPPFEKLSLDHWYKVLMAVGLAVFVLAGSGFFKEFPAGPTALCGLGVFFIGMGEWINHPLQTKLMAGSAMFPAGVVTSHPRNPRPIGVFFDIVGVALLGYGVFRLYAYSGRALST